jgi:methylated-DNA-[protein]-cysteine S-methyltransferase
MNSSDHSAVVSTPLGPFEIVVDEDGVVLDCGWTEATETNSPRQWRGSPVAEAADAVVRYWRGEVHAIDAVPVACGDSFAQIARRQMRTVPPGETITYTELARRSGNERAVRAAASACANNRTPLFVPCHRILRSDGTLGGFAYGLDAKTQLLRHENEHARKG